MLQAAARAAGGQQYPAGALYVVATPIGNFADITLRAVHVLSIVDALACEDTRVSAGLLRHLGLDKPLLSLHEHNEREATRSVLDRLARGERIAYVSDAGTPALSDPGSLLVDAAQAAGYRTIPVPGASAASAALSVAGDPGGARFVFTGFLATRATERGAEIAHAASLPDTQVLFEAPHRIQALADALAASCGSRRVTLCRELTKQFETVVTLTCAELPGWLAADHNRQRGEFVVVLHAKPRAASADASTQDDHLLTVLLHEMPLKQAVAIAARLSATPRNALYERALALRRAADA